jgi:hypothetical protein
MVKISDLALIGGIGVILFLAIRAGRDLFGALPSLGAGLGEAGESIQNFFIGGGEAISDAVTGAGQAVGEAGAVVGESVESGVGSLQTGIGGDLNAVTDFFSNLFGGSPQTQPEFQGAAIVPSTGESLFTDPNRPLDLTQFAAQLGITPAEAFKIQKDSGDMALTELAGAISTPQGDSFQQFGNVPEEFSGGFTIKSNNPLTDIINKFKESAGVDLTASQAANISSQLDPDPQFSNFDFGTNTGNALKILESGINFGTGGQNQDLALAIQAAIAAQNPVFEGTSNFANPNF